MLVIPVPCLFDNFAYIIGCEQTRQCAVVDPSEYYPVAAAIEKNGLHLTTVLCTHHHQDHIDGLEDLMADYPDIKICGHHTDQPRQPLINKTLTEGDKIVIGMVKGQVHHTPGHTTGSCVYHFDMALFTGDTVFGAGCGRLFEGTAMQMSESFKRIQHLFHPETKIYPGHDYTRANLEFAKYLEPQNQAITERIRKVELDSIAGRYEPSTLASELKTNPFFRCDRPSFQAAAAILGVRDFSSPVELFQVIRQMKDNF
jgi:hydroxyacylglutathione hydrolase